MSFARPNYPAPKVTRQGHQLFDGLPVMTFQDENQRRTFLRAAVLVGVGSTLVAATRGDQHALADASANDLEILNYALTLEYLEAEFYTRGVKGGSLTGRALELVSPIRDHEQDHVTVLTQTVKSLGGKPAAKPSFKFPNGHIHQQGEVPRHGVRVRGARCDRLPRAGSQG